jgi:hypothetical protein
MVFGRMVFGRKKGGKNIDAFGPGDVLLGAAGRLPEMYSTNVVRYVTDDAFAEQAADLMARMHRDDIESFNQICRSCFAGAVSLTQQRELVRGREELALVFSITKKCLSIFGFELVPDERVEELSLIYAAVKGATRMAELRRPEQAMISLSLAVMLVVNVIDQKAGDVQIFTVSWGENKKNKCVFFVNDKGEVSWTPQTDELPLITEDRIMVALAELEIALGRNPSFSEELHAKSEYYNELIREGAVSVSEVAEPFFTWEPPLDQLRKSE